MSTMGGMAAASWLSGQIAAVGSGAGAGSGASLVDRWRDLGGELWIVAAAITGLWFVLFGLLAAATNPRRVEPGPGSLDLGGPEPPAVVNLITRDWRLGRDALPATLLDLAARGYFAIDQVGEQTLVRARNHGADRADDTDADDATTSGSRGSGDLTAYEWMVLDHVRGLASRADDGAVPAEALTIGPDEGAKGWWRRFERAVRDDARHRGLSRARWSPAIKLTLGTVGVIVAFTVAVAASATWDEIEPPPDTTGTTTSSDEGDNPIVGAIVSGLFAFGGLMTLVSVTDRERDTSAGREAAARWLGLRELLSTDPVFGSQPPAGIAIWDRHLAYGASLSVAHGAVRALPLGAESDREAWSSVGGRWRRVRVRYPTRIPPGYGRHPLRVASVGLLQLLLCGYVLSELPGLPDAIADAVRDVGSEDTVGRNATLIDLVALLVSLILAIVAGAIVLRAAVMFVLGAADLVTGPRLVEGRVLRFRTRGDDEHRTWRVAVDDGTTDEIRAWLLRSAPHAYQGATVRARVTRHLAHVTDLERVGAHTTTHTTPDATPDATLDATS